MEYVLVFVVRPTDRMNVAQSFFGRVQEQVRCQDTPGEHKNPLGLISIPLKEASKEPSDKTYPSAVGLEPGRTPP